jgi:hypothetical protein
MSCNTGILAKKKGKIGSSFDGFLAEEGILETCEEQALKQILADQIVAAMEREPHQVRDGGSDADQQARSRSVAGPQEYQRDAAHDAARRRSCWKATPFGTGITDAPAR